MSEKYPSLSQEANPEIAKKVIDDLAFDRVMPRIYEIENTLKEEPLSLSEEEKEKLNAELDWLYQQLDILTAQGDEANKRIRIGNDAANKISPDVGLAASADKVKDMIRVIDPTSGLLYNTTLDELRDDREKSGAAYGRLS